MITISKTRKDEMKYEVWGVESGWIKDCRTKKEARESIKELIEFDKESEFIFDLYYIVKVDD